MLADMVKLMAHMAKLKAMQMQTKEANSPIILMRAMWQLLTAVVEEEVITPISALLASADVIAGEKVAKKCVACHTFAEGGQNRIGPNQWDIVNRALGTTEGFAYSEALLAKGGAWDYESLNEFIYNPKKYIPNTKMNFAGIKNDKDRANLILWIRSLSSNPAPLP